MAVERFVTVGETIADDNPEIKQDMYEACKEARTAGKTFIFLCNLEMLTYRCRCFIFSLTKIGLSIERLCELVANEPLEPDDTLCDRSAMVRAARSLLNSVTRVLLLADIVVVKQLLLAKDKVSVSQFRS